MFAITPPIAPPPADCESRPYEVVLYADEARKAKVNLPPKPLLRACAPPELSQVMTAPDSGGTTMCVSYVYDVALTAPDRLVGERRLLAAKSLPDKSCPQIDFKRQGFPGKPWMFLYQGVVVENAYKVKEKIESEGLAFLQLEQTAPGAAKPQVELGKSPLYVSAIQAATPSECRAGGQFFQERFPACYKASVYNQNIRGWQIYVALRRNGEYKFGGSKRNP